MDNINFRDYFNDVMMKDPAFKKEWEDHLWELKLGEQIIKLRIKLNLSQRALAKKAKTTQAVISRIENMNMNPSVALLDKIARSVGKKLVIKFV